jgi:hypothetical protein
MAAELGGARLERHPGPQAGFLEEHRHGPPGQRRSSMAATGPELSLQLGSAIEEPLDLRPRQVRDAQQIATTQRARGRHQAGVRAAPIGGD